MGDANSHSDEVGGAEGFADRAHPPIACVTASALEAKLPFGQVHFVMNYEQPLGRNLVVAEHRAGAVTTAVIKRLWHDRNYAPCLEGDFGIETVELPTR